MRKKEAEKTDLDGQTNIKKGPRTATKVIYSSQRTVIVSDIDCGYSWCENHKATSDLPKTAKELFFIFHQCIIDNSYVYLVNTVGGREG